MSLTADQIRWVAHLARLEFDPAEIESFAQELSKIVAYVDQLQEVNVDQVEPLSHPLPLQNVFREDGVAASLPVEEALANAPARKGDFYTVPAVLD